MFDSFLPVSLLTIKHEHDCSFHVKTYVYRIKTGRGTYIAHLEKYIHDFNVIKFYPVRYKRYPDRFNRTTNDKVAQTVIGTCLEIMSMHLRGWPNSSVGFIASPSIIGDFVEDQHNNQRFRIYKNIMRNFFGTKSFDHFGDVTSSAYLMINKKQQNIREFVKEMQTGFGEMYPDLFNLQFVPL
jgi:hypothetical protein